MSGGGRIRTALLRVQGDIWTWSLTIDGRIVEVGERQPREQAEQSMKSRRALWALADRHRRGVVRAAEEADETEAEQAVARRVARTRY